MSSASPPATRELVLAGGGHSHALLLRMVATDPIDRVRITLISDVSMAPYSGMLPGHLGGIYSYEESHIDLPRLAAFAGATFVLGEVTGVDLEERQVMVQGRPSVRFDALSINTGGIPTVADIPGAAEFGVTAKPVPGFLNAWNSLLADLESGAIDRARLAIVGGGAGGVEVALAAKSRLGEEGEVSLIGRGDELLPTHNPRVRSAFRAALENAGVRLSLGGGASEITRRGVRLSDGGMIEADLTAVITGVGAPDWIGESGLPSDDDGFVLISETLQSPGLPFVFAAGDVASMPSAPRPKSGVFAVRMAKPLLRNLRAYFGGGKPVPYRPQRQFLSLIGMGDGKAVASHGPFCLKSALMWKWKDHIDRKFMARFSDLPPVPPARSGKVRIGP